MGHHGDEMEKEEREERSEERVSDVRVYGCHRTSRSYGYTHVDVCTLPGRCTERPTGWFRLNAQNCVPD